MFPIIIFLKLRLMCNMIQNQWTFGKTLASSLSSSYTTFGMVLNHGWIWNKSIVKLCIVKRHHAWGFMTRKRIFLCISTIKINDILLYWLQNATLFQYILKLSIFWQCFIVCVWKHLNFWIKGINLDFRLNEVCVCVCWILLNFLCVNFLHFMFFLLIKICLQYVE